MGAYDDRKGFLEGAPGLSNWSRVLGLGFRV